ncbi:cysteine-rich receptor-like protein kinase, partial [Trifolium medium]|nr:cysteine-rich receptor-like protein kinase [Trifolium medium]
MKGCLYLGPSCSVRYDITPFFQSIVMNNTNSPAGPAPQPSQALPPALSPKTATSAISINTSTSK